MRVHHLSDNSSRHEPLLTAPRWISKLPMPPEWREHFIEEINNLPTALHYRSVAQHVWGTDTPMDEAILEAAEWFGMTMRQVERTAESSLEILYESLQRKYGGSIDFEAMESSRARRREEELMREL